MGVCAHAHSMGLRSSVTACAGLAGLAHTDTDKIMGMRDEATFTVKSGLAEMLKGGVIMDVVTPGQAKVAEAGGPGGGAAAGVVALEGGPADIRRDGGVARMSDPEMISGIQEAVSIPVMAKARIGHFMEAGVLEARDCAYVAAPE